LNFLFEDVRKILGSKEEVVMPEHVEWSDNFNVQIGMMNKNDFERDSNEDYFRWNVFTK
jgi:hypothetical protein